MTLNEYQDRLRELPEEELRRFNEDFGGGQKTVEQRVREFVDHPEYERRVCQLLGLKTEAEKLAEATLTSANAATQSASSARWSAISAVIACVAAIAGVVVAIIALLKNG